MRAIPRRADRDRWSNYGPGPEGSGVTRVQAKGLALQGEGKDVSLEEVQPQIVWINH